MKVQLFSAAAAVSLATVQAWSGVSSDYTSVDPKDCKTLETSEGDPQAEIDSYIGECAAIPGYKVLVAGGDIRYDLKLSAVSSSGQEKDIPLPSPPAFHDMGASKIEWRYSQTAGGAKNYFALIYRLSISSPVDTARGFSELYVVRLDGEKSCLIGRVRQGRLQNEKARKIADNAHAVCIEP